MTVNFLEPLLGEESTVPGFELRGDSLGMLAGAAKLGASLYELPPGQAVCPYHWHAANEEMLIVVEGPVELRDSDGWHELASGDVVAFPRGERGAHQVRAPATATAAARVILLSEMRRPEIAVYPDSGKVGVRELVPGSPREGLRLNFRMADAVDYWDGEATPPPEAG